MKKLFLLCFSLIALGLTTKAQSTFDQWPALKEFHGVMSGTFHPAEEGNFKPIKTRSEELLNKATALQKSIIPKAYNKPTIIASIKKLSNESEKMDKLVKEKADDKAIMTQLNKVHDCFHEIVGLCKSHNE